MYLLSWILQLLPKDIYW